MNSDAKINWRQWLVPGVVTVLIIAAGYVGYSWEQRQATEAAQSASASLSDSPVDPGTNLYGKPAPNFTLTNQDGQHVSLQQYRGKVVVLAFVDSECTTICPLTTASMLDALQMLTPQNRSQVQLLGVDANPAAISVKDVRTYTQDHLMQGQWNFVTGSLPKLKSVWKDYGIDAQIVQGQIDHTPALYVIDPHGHEQRVYLTAMLYGTVHTEAAVLAHDIYRYLASPSPQSLPPLEYKQPSKGPGEPITLPEVTAHGLNGTVSLQARTPHTLVFLGSWQSGIRSELKQINQLAQEPGIPKVVAVDVGSTEQNKDALSRILKTLPPLSYPIGYDATGDVADAFEAQDLSWITATNAAGKIVWRHDGWVSPSTIQHDIKGAIDKSH